MSVRSFRRAQARRQAREQRRLGNLKRRGAMAAGVALSASALFAANAQAADYVVNSATDDPSGGTCNPSPGTCTLRDAISSANGDSSTDAITFDPSLSGQTIDLSYGALSITHSGGLTITGPGSGSLTVSAAGNSQVFTIGSGSGQPIEVDGLTITDGSGTSAGGAIDSSGAHLTLNNDVISGSTSTGEGGGIYSHGILDLTGTTVSGNNATGVGGGLAIGGKYGMDMTDSTVSGNTGSAGGGTAGGDYLSVSGSQITGNTATDNAGGIESASKYGTTITGSTISGNTVTSSSGLGGGLEIEATSTKYNPVQVSDTTISGNTATYGAGVDVTAQHAANPVTITHSTLSGNTGGVSSFGGGLLLESGIASPFELVDSTVSGNSATQGGGIDLSPAGSGALISGSKGSITFDNSTIAKNIASGTGEGGGIYLGEYSGSSGEQSGTVEMTSTIVASNTAAGAQNDLARASTSTSGGFDTGFDLIEANGGAPLLTQKHDLVGIDPKLGPLANNGGPTETMLPSGSSPVIAHGHADNANKTDQRGLPRTVANPQVVKPPGGDGTDIGAVELPANAVASAGFSASIHGQKIRINPPLLLAGHSTPVNCSVKVETISSCRVAVLGYATGSAYGHAGLQSIGVRVHLTRAGRKALEGHPFGLIEPIRVAGESSRSGARALGGYVRLLAGPSITLDLPAPGKSFGGKLTAQLKRAATLLSGAGAKSVTCTAYAGSGSTASEASSQAKAACNQMKQDGFSGTLTSAGKAGSQRRLVIVFRF